jgi:spore germination protein KA
MHLLGKVLSKILERKISAKNKSVIAEQKERLHSAMETNFHQVNTEFGNSSDIVTERIHCGSAPSIEVGLIYMKGLADTKIIQEHIKEPFMTSSAQTSSDFNVKPIENIRNIVSAAGEPQIVVDFPTVYESILSGKTVILIDGQAVGLSADTKGGSRRAVEEPTTQSVVRGPREGFIESMDTNIALLRNRIKSPKLWLETRSIGRVTHTKVGILYIKGIVNDKIIEEVRTRLERIDIDGILESGYIEELIQDEALTPFPTIFNSERPDVIAAGLLEGRVAILMDGTPFVLLVPALFVQFYQSAEDYYQRADFATLIRILRYICFFVSLLAPSLYIAITTFHQELLPSPLLFSLAAQREGIPFPALVEALIMEVTFEILREAGVRLPKTVGQAVSIVGALVIGQAAVEAGLVSPAMVIIVSITAISNFVIPSFNMGISVRILRFFLMAFAATFGLFGVTVGLIAMVQHLCSLRSFGVPYMSPMAPFIIEDQKDTILRMPQWGLFTRPRFISQKNITRETKKPPTKPEGTRG